MVVNQFIFTKFPLVTESTLNSKSRACLAKLRSQVRHPHPARPPRVYCLSMRCIFVIRWPKEWTQKATAYIPLKPS